MLCHRPLGDFGQNYLAIPFLRRLVCCPAGGAAAENRYRGPRATTCRRARHGTCAGTPESRARSFLYGNVVVALLLSPASRGPPRCPADPGKATLGYRGWQRRTGLGAPWWRSGGDLRTGPPLPGRSAWTHRQARGAGVGVGTTPPARHFHFPSWETLSLWGGGNAIRN